ncbi:MAG: UDP-2,3-diacylglucosamine diphosphatase [Flavihumibacter sp.]
MLNWPLWKKRSVDVAVLSDLHLGTYGSKAAEVLNYLRSISPQMLILNGDIIDGWQFSKRYFPQLHMAVLKEILTMMAQGTRVVYITGNHDDILRRYCDIQLGNFQLTDKHVIEINKKTTWIFHGDVFDNTTKGAAKVWAKLGSSGYGCLILINRVINRLMKCIGRDRVSLSKSVMAGVNRAYKVNEFETYRGGNRHRQEIRLRDLRAYPPAAAACGGNRKRKSDVPQFGRLGGTFNGA